MEGQINKDISKNIDENISYVKQVFESTSDIVYKQFYIGNSKAVLIYIDGLGDKVLLNDFILESTMLENHMIKNMEEVKERLLTVTDVKDVESFEDALKALLSGDTIIFQQERANCMVVASRAWPYRGVSEPSAETVIRGSRDGFTETMRFNTALIRRRIRDTRLKVEPKSIGVRSKTDVAIMYIDDIVNKDVLAKLKSRVDDINIDAIMDSGYIEQLIEDNRWSPFPQVQITERPDVVAAALYEGKVALVVDNSPTVLIVPATLPALFQSPDDYYQRWMHASIVRVVRIFAIILSLILPPLYIAVTSFHTSIIPTKLAYSIAASREGVPFPAFIEVLIMEISLAFLIEAVVRLPKPIGATIGIVGGLIIGQAAVSAGVVSPIMIIIVSITALTNFITPSYEVASAFRLIRFFLIIASSIIGLYGIMLGLIVVLIHLIRLKSFGIAYLSPVVNSNIGDFKDMYVRVPIQYMKRRPQYMKTGDKIRQK